MKPSPKHTRGNADPGADVQRRFQYQNAYGVILLAAGIRGDIECQAVWCEHHDDLLVERGNGVWDAYQVKTRYDGVPWSMTDDDVVTALSRFVALDALFPGLFAAFHFVSNAPLRTPSGVPRRRKGSCSPLEMLGAVAAVASAVDLDQEWRDRLDATAKACGTSAVSVFRVLRRLTFTEGPQLSSFRAEILQDHLSALVGEALATPLRLGSIYDALLSRISQAAALHNVLPERHLPETPVSGPLLLRQKSVSVREARDIVDGCLAIAGGIVPPSASLARPPVVALWPHAWPLADDLKYRADPNFTRPLLIKESVALSGVERRGIANTYLLERFHAKTRRWASKPIIRLYGNFTALSTDRTGSSDYDQIILAEVQLIERYIRDGYEVRVCASLDVRHILSTWTSRERLITRVDAMVEQLKRLEPRYSNLRVVVDAHSRVDSVLILGDSLVVRSALTTYGLGYSLTAYENDPVLVARAVRNFDEAFGVGLQIADAIRGARLISTTADYVKLVAEHRLTELDAERQGGARRRR